MNRAEMLAELRDVLNDSATNGVWATTTLLGYLSEGQDKFCEETGYFTDISNFTLTLQTGVAMYAIPDRVIQIIDIWNGATKLSKVLTGEDYDDAGYGWNISTTGMPIQWRTDQETGLVSLSPTPTATENGEILTLQVWRYSRYDLAGLGAVPVGGGAAPPAEPEIPSRFHRACIEWAAYKAFNHHDMEAQDPVKAKDHYALFRSYVADGRQSLIRRQNIESRVGTNAVYRA
jgi:hypothetical protein